MIRIHLFTLMRIRIQLPKIMRIEIHNPDVLLCQFNKIIHVFQLFYCLINEDTFLPTYDCLINSHVSVYGTVVFQTNPIVPILFAPIA